MRHLWEGKRKFASWPQEFALLTLHETPRGSVRDSHIETTCFFGFRHQLATLYRDVDATMPNNRLTSGRPNLVVCAFISFLIYKDVAS